MGYFLPPKSELSFPYIFDILSGRKKLLKYEQISIFVPPPRIKQLWVKTLWAELRNDIEFCRYFSNRAMTNQPNRRYFFTVLATVYKDQYIQLLQRTQNKRKKIEASKNRAILINHDMLNLIDSLNDLSLIRTSQKTKRICTRYPERRKNV